MRACLVAALMLACHQDYNIPLTPDAYGQYNPADLENPLNQDRIVQTTSAKVDILFVVDNSSSMSDNQDALASNFPAFMDYFVGSGLDYHIGVVSTDPSAAYVGKLIKSGEVVFIDSNTPDPLDVFGDMVRIPEGSSDERGREAVYHALVTERDAANAGFVRDEAALHITVVSDEDDHSRAEPVTKDEFVVMLNQARPTDDMVSFNSIVNPPPGNLVNQAGEAYLYVTDLVGGLKRDIKSGDWSTMLVDLGLQATGLKREYFLSQVPVDGSITVEVLFEGDTVTYLEGATGFLYDPARNSITFQEYVPPELAEVTIHYELLGAHLATD
jgi:hypothetical protein